MASRQTTRTRAKDDDRSKTCQILDGALGDGQLSMEEHRQRVATATAAQTLGELQGLVDDLQTDQSPVRLPELKKPLRLGAGGEGRRREWGFAAAVSTVLIVLGIAIGWGVYGNSSSPLDFTTDPGAKPDGVVPNVETPPYELQSLGGLSGFFTQMRQKFGDTMGYSLEFEATSADLDRADPKDDRRVLSYDYEGGFGDPSSSTKSESQRLVDLAKFDWAAIVARIKAAPQILDLGSQTVDRTRVSIEPVRDQADDVVNVQIYVYGEFTSGYIDIAPDGSCKRCAPVTS